MLLKLLIYCVIAMVAGHVILRLVVLPLWKKAVKEEKATLEESASIQPDPFEQYKKSKKSNPNDAVKLKHK